MKPTFTLTYGLGLDAGDAAGGSDWQAGGVGGLSQTSQFRVQPTWRLGSALRCWAKSTIPKSVLPWWAIPTMD